MPAKTHPPIHSVADRPWLLWTTVAALVFIAVGALPAGYSLIADPSGRAVGFPEGTLASPIFRDYLVPGLFLFFVNGIGSLLAAGFLLLRPQWKSLARLNPVKQQEWTWTFGVLMGIILVVWIVVQIVSVTLFSYLQPLIAGVAIWIIVSLMAPNVRRYFALKTGIR